MNYHPEHGKFFQFPLCLLAEQRAFTDLLNRCFQSGVAHYLAKQEPGWAASKQSRAAAYAKAQPVIGFKGGDPESANQVHKSVSDFEREWKSTGRKTCWIRLRTDIHFDVRDNQVLSERDWRVLCAVFSAIGDKPMVRIGWKGVQSRAAGWLTPPSANARPCGPTYPRGQIERSLSKLIERGFVFAATYKHGERFWSHRLDHEELWAEVKSRKLRKSSVGTVRRKVDELHSIDIQRQLYGAQPLKLAPSLKVPQPAVEPARQLTAV